MANDRAKRFTSTLRDAIEEYRYVMQARAMSAATINDYSVAYRYFLGHVDGQTLMHEITHRDIISFLETMGSTPVEPGGVAPRPKRKRQKKTLRNYHIALSSLWTWAVAEGYADEHIVRRVKPPKANPKPVVPLTDAEVATIFHACDNTRPWGNKPLTKTERHTVNRDKAIVLVLYDAGLRNSELRNLTLSDLDMNNDRLFVRAGKGDKDRYVSFGLQTKRALYRWLVERPVETTSWGNYLFTNVMRYKGRQMSNGSLNQLIKGLASKVGIEDVTPHRFRHTCAVRSLQNGLDAFQLRAKLGHADIKSTQRYVNIAELEMDEAMRRTSPADTLRL